MRETRRQLEMPDSWEDEDPLAPGAEEAPKKRYPREEAGKVAMELLEALVDGCVADRLRICGSMRRGRDLVGDVEIVFVSRMVETRPAQRDLLGGLVSEAVVQDRAAVLIDELMTRGVLSRRLKKDGTCSWGRWNKLAVHVASGIPVDFFGCEERAWWNTLVCRTGGAMTNTRIAAAAIAKGWKWSPGPTSAGFVRKVGLSFATHPVHSEEDVFRFVGLNYLEAFQRE